MSLGSRKASRHETVASAKTGGTDPSIYWEHKPGTRVMTVDGVAGTVTAVLDGPVAGNEAYEVSLDKGMGGGLYTASQLTPAATTTASTTHTADQDYPELGTVLVDRPDIAINTVLASKTAGGKCAFCDMESNAAGANGEVLHPTRWGKMHPSCAYEWEHGSGEAYGHDIDAWRRDSHDSSDYTDADDDGDSDSSSTTASKVAFNDAEESQASSERANNRQAEMDSMPREPNTWCGSCSHEWDADEHGNDACPSCGEKERVYDIDRDDDPEDDYYERPWGEPDTIRPQSARYPTGWFPTSEMCEEDPNNEGHCAYHNEYHDESDEPEDEHPGEPESDDSFIHSPAMGGYSATHGGHHLGTYPNYGAAQHAIFSKEKETGYYPNLWHVNERGSADLDDGGERVKWEQDPHRWRMENDEHYNEAHNAQQQRDVGDDVDDAMEGSEHLKGLLDDNKIGPTKYSSAEPRPFADPSDHYALVSEAASDADFRFEFTASWSDVRAKAKRIRAEGGIRIVSASGAGVVAEVKGDHHIYETGLQYVPGKRSVATWQCGCKWAAYAWGRSPQYKRFEGRMCSHALAVQYEAQSRGMFGRDVKEDSHRMPGQHQRTPVVVEFDKDRDKNITRRTVPPGNMRSVWSSVVEPAPIITAVAAMAISGDDADEIGLLLTASRIPADGLVAFAKTAAVNDAWGEPVAPQNTWPTLPGATSPRDPNENPASAGWAAGVDPVGWRTISPGTMGDRVASHYSEEAEDGDTDVCSNCGESIKRTTIDPGIPWIHHHSGNAKCDVSSPADAVMLQGIDSGWAEPTMHEASMSDTDEAMWDSQLADGATATLNDEPEPALPSTDGSTVTPTEGLLGDQSDQMHAVYDDALSPESESIMSTGSVQDIVAEFQRTAGASAIMAGGGRSSAGPSDGDIAAAAREHLEKMALKSYSPAEQRALIHEKGKARNTDMLDIADTHYAALDAMRGDDETDEDWLG